MAQKEVAPPQVDLKHFGNIMHRWGKVTPAFGSVRTFEYDIAAMNVAISMTSLWAVGVNGIDCLLASALRKTFSPSGIADAREKLLEPKPTYQKCLTFVYSVRPCGGFLDGQGQTNRRWLDCGQLEWC